MCRGMAGITVAVAIRLGSASPLLLPIALILVLDQPLVRRTELSLRKVLGVAYGD